VGTRGAGAWFPGKAAAAAAAAGVFLAGCSDARFLARTCPSPPDPAAASAAPAPAADYRLTCPDVLEVAVADRPGWDAVAALDLDGRLPLGDRPRVEGLTLDEAREAVARAAGVPAGRVHLALAAPRGGRVYVHGPVRGHTRVVPYQGPEPVVGFLRRVGGLPPGSELSAVYVVRPNVAAGGRAEVFRVNAPAVLLDQDQSTNVTLRPSDQVYVGETRGSSFSRALPSWLGPAYRRLLGLFPDEWWPFTRRPAAARE
jgi:protein involved in polysaccharide export with SLBB domain